MLTPLNERQWDLQKAAHLLNRAGFGGTPDEIKAFCELGFDRAVETVLDGPDDSAQFPKPAWAQPKNLLLTLTLLPDEPLQRPPPQSAEPQSLPWYQGT